MAFTFKIKGTVDGPAERMFINLDRKGVGNFIFCDEGNSGPGVKRADTVLTKY